MKAGLVDGIVLVVSVGAVSFAGLNYFRGGVGSAVPVAQTVPSLDTLMGRSLQPLPVLRPNGSSNLRAFGDTTGPALLVYFRSTCPACERTAPVWQSIIEGLPAGVKVFAINGEGEATANAWLRRHGIKVTELIVPSDGAMTVAQSWGITAVPLTIALGGNGRIETAQLGVLSEDAARGFRSALSRDRGSR